MFFFPVRSRHCSKLSAEQNQPKEISCKTSAGRISRLRKNQPKEISIITPNSGASTCADPLPGARRLPPPALYHHDAFHNQHQGNVEHTSWTCNHCLLGVDACTTPTFQCIAPGSHNAPGMDAQSTAGVDNVWHRTCIHQLRTSAGNQHQHKADQLSAAHFSDASLLQATAALEPEAEAEGGAPN